MRSSFGASVHATKINTQIRSKADFGTERVQQGSLKKRVDWERRGGSPFILCIGVPLA